MTFSSSSIGAATRPASSLDRHVASRPAADKPVFTRGGGAGTPAPSIDGGRPGMWLREHVGGPLRTVALHAQHLKCNLQENMRHLVHRQGPAPHAPVLTTNDISEPVLSTFKQYPPVYYQNGWTSEGPNFVQIWPNTPTQPTADPLITYF